MFFCGYKFDCGHITDLRQGKLFPVLRKEGKTLSKELEEVLKKVEELRVHMQRLLKTQEPLSPEVVAASKMLDEMLNVYYEKIKNGN